MKYNFYFFILMAITIWQPAMSQEKFHQFAGTKKLRIYLEGETKDFDYQRRSIHYVDFVNDPKIADIQVITTRVMLGNGGRQYFLNFYSGAQRDVIDFKHSFIRELNDTGDIQRVKFRKALEIGLLHYLNESSVLDQIEITYTPIERNPSNLKDSIDSNIPEKDPWNLWVFRLTGTGGWDLEESKTSVSLSGSIQADRISDTWMIRNYFSHQSSTRTYTQSEDEIYKSINIVDKAQSRVVIALSDHWSAGLFLNADRSTYLNTDFDIYLKPAIEYNFFTWEEADQKKFTMAYFVGPAYYKYRDTTFLDKIQETLWEHNLLVQLELVQPWGEVDVQLGYEGYLTDLANYNLSAEADLSIRVSKGISITFELVAESVHNQLYLPKDEVSLEELLLNSRKLPTTFQFGGEVGVRFYFGSIFNNIVNERL